MTDAAALADHRAGSVDGTGAPWRVNGAYRSLCAAVAVSEIGDWLLFIALPEGLRIANELRLVIFGVLLVLLALYAPRGVCGLVAALSRRLDARGLAAKEPELGRHP